MATPRPLFTYKVIPNSPLMRFAPKSWTAFATAEAIHLRGDSCDEATLAHEGTHVRQLRDSGGTLRGLLKWLHLVLQYGYEQNPWEMQARCVEERVRKSTPAQRDKMFKLLVPLSSR